MGASEELRTRLPDIVVPTLETSPQAPPIGGLGYGTLRKPLRSSTRLVSSPVQP